MSSKSKSTGLETYTKMASTEGGEALQFHRRFLKLKNSNI
jgi:hypothetical protein